MNYSTKLKLGIAALVGTALVGMTACKYVDTQEARHLLKDKYAISQQGNNLEITANDEVTIPHKITKSGDVIDVYLKFTSPNVSTLNKPDITQTISSQPTYIESLSDKRFVCRVDNVNRLNLIVGFFIPQLYNSELSKIRIMHGQTPCSKDIGNLANSLVDAAYASR